MKYWKDSEVQRIVSPEGHGSVMPYKHPASKVVRELSTGELTEIEIEIIPNTSEVRDHIDYATFENSLCLCVKVERRQWRADGRYYEEVIWVPLKVLGYVKEPYSSKSFDSAMKDMHTFS